MKYEYLCQCGRRFERILPMRLSRYWQVCECGWPAPRVMSRLALAVSQPECHYRSPIDDRPITSHAQRMDDLARHNCLPYDPEVKTDYLRQQRESEAALDKNLQESVEASIERMPYKKRAKLFSEVTEQGADVGIDRSTGTH